MMLEMVIGAGAVAAGLVVFARWQRLQLYRGLQGQIDRIAAAPSFDPGAVADHVLPDFSNRLAVVRGFLPAEAFSALKAEAEKMFAPERSYIPTHKKGGTVAYETLIANTPAVVSCYHSKTLMELVSRIVGVRVEPTPINDQSSLSLLFYTRPGDHIGWHYDHNFYKGRHFTVLLALDNEGRAEGGLESCRAESPYGRTRTLGRHRAEYDGRVRRRGRAAQSDADSGRRTAAHAQHDLLHRSRRHLASGRIATHEGYRVFRNARALDLSAPKPENPFFSISPNSSQTEKRGTHG